MHPHSLTLTLTHAHTHTLTQTDDEQVVAIKTCKPDASHEERTKFLEEAGQPFLRSSLLP